MKVVILAGGMGTRLAEESEYRPKPMAEIGGMPILWHIMKEYSQYGFYEFVICAGYKQAIIKEWFADYYINQSDVTFDYSGDREEVLFHCNRSEPWRVTVADTGLKTMTGGRLRRVKQYIGDETFMMTYGDGLCDVDIGQLVEFHRSHGKIATLTAVKQMPQKGILSIDETNSVRSFREKHMTDGVTINAGYMVLESQIFDYIEGDETILETGPLERLAAAGELMSYVHEGFWQCMDTKREMLLLEDLYASGKAPWKKWKDDRN